MKSSPELNCGVAGFQARFGIARVEITPPIGIYLRNWGAAKFDTADSIHRPLYLTALTISSLDDESTEPPLIMVSGDLGWWKSASLFGEMQHRLLEQLGCPEENFWFALTHTHAAVPLQPANASLEGGEMMGDYLALLESKIVDVAKMALSDSKVGILDWHYGTCNLAKVRDLPDRENPSEKVSCGFNPELEPDDTLLVGRVTCEAGKPLATIVNYACHPTTLAWQNRAISPDYIGAMQEVVERETEGALSVFLQGASGEVAPREQYTANLEIVDRHGRQLGYSVLAILADMHPPSSRYEYQQVEPSGAPLAVWEYKSIPPRTDRTSIKQEISLPLKSWPTADELAQQAESSPDRFQQERLYRQREIRMYVGDHDQWPLPVWCWQLGEAVLMGTMAEGYTVLQQELRDQFKDRHVVCMNLLNGSIGYLAPVELYDQDIYQVWQSPFERGSLEQLIGGVAEMIQSLPVGEVAK
ncbi:hypothetical protein Pla110_17100 [Polystyrenella longa]|uniref:Neutral/alkaline non-lysosomal ceramidase n=1 Tax=Polystyrenella longa TaxID=2528007 RepID=A0A518CL82_9PLAN|nr:alkaline ceramidase [Polystyrenella longa]QDU79988.1 hypothetical protein Pla110_17100 [Polystyrenella longa]